VKPTKDFGPQTWRFWFSNIQDTTRSGYPLSEANRVGGNWTIDAAYIADGGANPDGTFAGGTLKQITYGGAATKKSPPASSSGRTTRSLTFPKAIIYALSGQLPGRAQMIWFPEAKSR
jgi:hypothetical protein